MEEQGSLGKTSLQSLAAVKQIQQARVAVPMNFKHTCPITVFHQWQCTCLNQTSTAMLSFLWSSNPEKFLLPSFMQSFLGFLALWSFKMFLAVDYSIVKHQSANLGAPLHMLFQSSKIPAASAKMQFRRWYVLHRMDFLMQWEMVTLHSGELILHNWSSPNDNSSNSSNIMQLPWSVILQPNASCSN